MSSLNEGSRCHYPNGFLIRYDTELYTKELKIEINDILESAECFRIICPRLDKYLSKKYDKPYARIAVETAKQITKLIGRPSRPKMLEINMSKIDVSIISGVRYTMTVKNGKWVNTLIFNVTRQSDIELFTKAFMKYYNKIKQEK